MPTPPQEVDHVEKTTRQLLARVHDGIGLAVRLVGLMRRGGSGSTGELALSAFGTRSSLGTVLRAIAVDAPSRSIVVEIRAGSTQLRVTYEFSGSQWDDTASFRSSLDQLIRSGQK